MTPLEFKNAVRRRGKPRNFYLLDTPTFVGDPVVDAVVTITPGDYFYGGTVTKTWKVKRNGTLVATLTDPSYTVVSGDIGANLTFTEVAATASDGSITTNLAGAIGPVIDVPSAGSVRYISPAGTGDGSSLGSPANFNTFNAQLALAGADGEIRFIADQGDYTVNNMTLSNDGTAGHPVICKGITSAGAQSRAVFKSTRTSPWPSGGPGATDGNRLFTLATGFGHVNFRDVEFKNTICAFYSGGANISGLSFGYLENEDTATLALEAAHRATYTKFQRASAAAVAAQAAVEASANAYNPALRAANLDAVHVNNVVRFIDTGVSEADQTNNFSDFKWIGGTVRGVGRGVTRIRGLGSNFLHQDVDSDAELQQPLDTFFCMQFECRGTTTDHIFLRCRADRSWGAPTGYQNGDGFNGEKDVLRQSWIACIANDNMDGGIETKAGDVMTYGIYAARNRRNRFWGWGYLSGIEIWDPTYRIGGQSSGIYTYGNVAGGVENFMVVNSGSINWTPGFVQIGDANNWAFDADGSGFLAVSNAVVINNPPASGYVKFHAANDGSLCFGFDPADTVAATVSSSGAITVNETNAASYKPTTNKNVRWYIKAGSADGTLFTVSPNAKNTFTLPPHIFGENEDANTDGVYSITGIGYTAQGASVEQTINVTVQAWTPTAPDIVARMTAAGSTPSAGQETAYETFLDRGISGGWLKKFDQLVIGTHSDAASRLSWAIDVPLYSGLEPDAARPFPLFAPFDGYIAESGRWCYFGPQAVNLTKMSATSASQFVWLLNPLPGDICGFTDAAISYATLTGSGAYDFTANATAAESGVFKTNSATPIKVDGVFDGSNFVGWDRKGSTVKIFKNGAVAHSQTLAANSALGAGRTRFGTRTDGTTVAKGQIAVCGMGMSLTEAEWADFYDALSDLRTFLTSELADDPPFNLKAPIILGVADVGEVVTCTNGVWTLNPTSYTYQWKVNGANAPGAGATTANYTIDASDVTKALTVEVTAHNANGASIPKASAGLTVNSPPPRWYVAPTAMGTGDGSAPENAKAITGINALIAANPSSVIRARADQGVYLLGAALTLSAGNVAIESWHPTDPTILAVFDGGRVSPFTPDGVSGIQTADGRQIFILAAGANNLVFRRFNAQNVGNGVIATTAAITGLTVYEVNATNCYRFIELSTYAHSSIYWHHSEVTGYERNAFRTAGDASQIVIEDIILDSQNNDDESFATGLTFDGTTHDVTVRRVTSKNHSWNPLPHGNSYAQGDAFECSGTVYRIHFEATIAQDNADGGYDCKGTTAPGDTYAITYTDAIAIGNGRNFRIWDGKQRLIRPHSENPTQMFPGTSNGPVHFGFYRDGTTADIDDPIVVATPGNTATVFKIDFPNCIVNVIGVDNIGPLEPGQLLVENAYPGSSVITFNPPFPGHDANGNPL